MGNFKGKAEGLFMHCLVYKGSAGFPISTLVVVVVGGGALLPSLWAPGAGDGGSN